VVSEHSPTGGHKKIALFGATGRHLLKQARAAGHQVTAVVRNPTRLATDVGHNVRGGIRVSRADVADFIHRCLANQDSVRTAISIAK
jgi:putative NADH-flavin reductase